MELIPVLDLLGGRAVHARGGRRDRYQPVESVLAPGRPGDALALAGAYRNLAGVRRCYVADLDAIMGGAIQEELIGSVISPAGFGGGVWVDAGVTAPAAIRRLVDLGVAGVVVGLESMPDPAGLPDLARAAEGIPLLLSLDLRNGRPVGPAGERTVSAEALALSASDAGVAGVLVLELEAVGRDVGPAHLPLIVALKHRLACPVFAGGGVRGTSDLSALERTGCDGVLVGTALHAGRLGGAYGLTNSR